MYDYLNRNAKVGLCFNFAKFSEKVYNLKKMFIFASIIIRLGLKDMENLLIKHRDSACIEMMRAGCTLYAARSTQHAARSTQHAARSTQHS
jgi:hypothetical protein